MKAKLTLNNPLWQTASRRAILDKAAQQSAAELEAKIKQKILSSVPAGKVYARGALTARANKAQLGLGLLRKPGTKTRVIIGNRFHRASAKGQPPAVDSGKLLNSIKTKQTAPLQITIFSNLRYAEILDNPQKLNRPFMRKERDNFRSKFKKNIADALKEKL